MIVAETEGAQAFVTRLAAKARRIAEVRRTQDWRDARALWPLFARED